MMRLATAPIVGRAAASMPGQILDKANPCPTARLFLCDHYTHADGLALVTSGGSVFVFTGPAFTEGAWDKLRSQLYPFLEAHQQERRLPKGGTTLEPFKPTKRDVDLVIDALSAATHVDARPPAWLSEADARDMPDPARLLVATNGVFNLHGRGLARVSRPTPRLFTLNAIGYAVQPNAPRPAEWLAFLERLWPDDPQSIELLAEWFGLCLTADTSQQKILALIGPPRSGKGTVARVLSAMIGMENVCGPTLSGLGTNFGMWPLLNKRLAIVSDARLSNRTDQAIVTERLLSISGEDALTIDRKNMAPVTARLTTRIMLLSNELPRLSDSSGALASRFLILILRESHLGREDTKLTERLLAELPGILNWAVDGWHRLRERGHFQQPDTGREAIEDLNDLSSPAAAFVRDWCAVRPGLRVAVPDLFDAWGLWCKEQGRDQPGQRSVFGRDLKAAVPGITTSQVMVAGDRFRCFEGIDLTQAARETLQNDREARQGHSLYGSTSR